MHKEVNEERGLNYAAGNYKNLKKIPCIKKLQTL